MPFEFHHRCRVVRCSDDGGGGGFQISYDPESEAVEHCCALSYYQ